jgi:hypothetical protein
MAEIFDEKEDDQINGVSIFADTQVNVVTDIAKTLQFNFRSFIDNNLKNPDFINNFKNKNISQQFFHNIEIDPTTQTVSTKQTRRFKLIEKCFNDNNNQINKKTEEYERVKIIINAYKSILHNSVLNKFSDLERPLFKTLSYYNYENNCLIYRNDVEFVKDYNITNFLTFRGFINSEINKNLDNFVEINHISRRQIDIAENFRNNPTVLGFVKYGNLREYYVKNQTSTNFITASIRWTNLIDKNLTKSDFNFFDSLNLKDLLIFDIDEDLIDKMVMKLGRTFNGFNLIYSDDRILLRIKPCTILRNKLFYYQNLNDKTKIPKLDYYQNETQCFLYNETNNINEIYGITNETIKQKIKNFKKQSYFNLFMNIYSGFSSSIERMISVPIFKNKVVRPGEREEQIFHKIKRIRIADVSVRFLMNSEFSTWSNPNLYLLKSSKIMNSYLEKTKNFMYLIAFKILTLDIITAILLTILITCLASRVSKSIGDPIKSLIDIVNTNEKNKENSENLNPENINSNLISENKDFNLNTENADGFIEMEKSQENEENKEKLSNTSNEMEKKRKELASIKYEDDYIIKTFFEICKSLIGHGIEREKIDKATFKINVDKAQDNISFVKFNNLIVQEQKIEEETRGKVHHIFNYDSQIDKCNSPNNENKYYIENENACFKKVIVKYKDIDSDKNNYYDNFKDNYNLKNSENNLDDDFVVDDIISNNKSYLNKYKEKFNKLDYYFENTTNNNNKKLDYYSLKSILSKVFSNNNQEENNKKKDLKNKKEIYHNVIQSVFDKKEMDFILKLVSEIKKED